MAGNREENRCKDEMGRYPFVAISKHHEDSARCSQKNLPDIISIPEADPVRLASTGLIIPMDDLIKKIMLRISETFFKQFPELEKSMKTPDGKNLRFILRSNRSGLRRSLWLLIRQDWLEKLAYRNQRRWMTGTKC